MPVLSSRVQYLKEQKYSMELLLSAPDWVAEARLPVEAHPTAFNLVSLAREIATPAGLSLNEKVGFIESFLINKCWKPNFLPSLSALVKE